MWRRRCTRPVLVKGFLQVRADIQVVPQQIRGAGDASAGALEVRRQLGFQVRFSHCWSFFSSAMVAEKTAVLSRMTAMRTAPAATRRWSAASARMTQPGKTWKRMRDEQVSAMQRKGSRR